MADEMSEKRRKFVMVVARRILDLPDDAPVEELKAALKMLGVDAEAAIERTHRFIGGCTGQILQQSRLEHEREQQAFRHFQRQFAGMRIEELKERIAERVRQISQLEPQIQAYYRDLSDITSEDAKSELVDFLWQLHKLAGSRKK